MIYNPPGQLPDEGVSSKHKFQWLNMLRHPQRAMEPRPYSIEGEPYYYISLKSCSALSPPHRLLLSQLDRFLLEFICVLEFSLDSRDLASAPVEICTWCISLQNVPSMLPMLCIVFTFGSHASRMCKQLIRIQCRSNPLNLWLKGAPYEDSSAAYLPTYTQSIHHGGSFRKSLEAICMISLTVCRWDSPSLKLVSTPWTGNVGVAFNLLPVDRSQPWWPPRPRDCPHVRSPLLLHLTSILFLCTPRSVQLSFQAGSTLVLGWSNALCCIC